MDVLGSFWYVSLIEQLDDILYPGDVLYVWHINYFRILPDYSFLSYNYLFNFDYFYYSNFFIYKSIFLLGFKFYIDVINFVVFSQITLDFYDWFSIYIINHYKFYSDFNEFIDYQVWYSYLCNKATLWHFYEPYKRNNKIFKRFSIPFSWCYDCKHIYNHIYRELWFYFIHDDLILNSNVSLEWSYTHKYGPIRRFYEYKKGWTPYHVYYFFSYNNDIKYILFSDYSLLKFDNYYKFLTDITNNIFINYASEWQDPSSKFHERYDLFWAPYLSPNYFYLLINKEPILWFIYNILYLHWKYWSYVFLFILIFLCIKIPILLITFFYNVSLFFFNYDKFIDNVRLGHDDKIISSLIYSLLTYYELKNSTFKNFLYLHRIQKIENLLKNRLMNYTDYYKYIVRSDFFMSFIYLRIVLFDLWRFVSRYLYFFFIFPFIFLFKFLFKIFFFYFDVLGLISFILYYINYILYTVYYNLSYNIYVNLVKFILYLKNLIAFATFFDFHFSFLRSIYFWLPKKFHFHDPIIYDQAYPSLNHPWFIRICRFINPIYFTVIDFIFVKIKNYIIIFFLFIQLSFILPLYKFMKYVVLFLIRKKKFILSYYIYNNQLFIIFYNFFFEWFFNKNIFIILLLFLFYYFYKFVFICIICIILLYFFVLLIFNYFISFFQYINFNYFFFFIGSIFCLFFLMFKNVLNLIFFILFRIILKLPIIFIILLLYFILNFNWIFIFELFNKLFFSFILDFLFIKLNFINLIYLELNLYTDWIDYTLSLFSNIDSYNFFFEQKKILHQDLLDMSFYNIWQRPDRDAFWSDSPLRVRLKKYREELFFLYLHILNQAYFFFLFMVLRLIYLSLVDIFIYILIFLWFIIIFIIIFSIIFFYIII